MQTTFKDTRLFNSVGAMPTAIRAALVFLLALVALHPANAQVTPPLSTGGELTNELKGSPSETFFNGTYYMAYDDYHTNTVTVATSGDGHTWSGGLNTGNGSNGSLSIAAFGSRLYILFSNGSGFSQISSADGVTWTGAVSVGIGGGAPPPNTSSTLNAPSIVAYNNLLYLAYVGSDDFVYQVSSSDGVNFANPFQAPSYTAQSSPGIGVYTSNGGSPVLEITYSTVSGTNYLVIGTSTGGAINSFENTAFRIGGNPCVVAWNGSVYVYARSFFDANNLWVTGSNGGSWTTPFQYGQQLHNSPSCAASTSVSNLSVSFMSGYTANIWSYSN